MAKMHLADLKPEMVVTRDVVDRNGRVLLGAGNTLSEKHIAIFEKWGVVEAEVEGAGSSDVHPEEMIDSALLAEAEERIEDLFQHTDPAHPAVETLRRLAIVQIARQLEETQHAG